MKFDVGDVKYLIKSHEFTATPVLVGLAHSLETLAHDDLHPARELTYLVRAPLGERDHEFESAKAQRRALIALFLFVRKFIELFIS